MSVMMQSYKPSPLAAMNCSADPKSFTRCPHEPSISASADRNGSSSSMTATRSSLDTHHPSPRDWPQMAARSPGTLAFQGGAKNDARVYIPVLCWLGLDHFGHPD